MPFARCKYYEDDGSAIDGGCRRSACAFIHPSDSAWQEAKSTDSGRGGRGRGSGKGVGRGRGVPLDSGWSGMRSESSWNQATSASKSVWADSSSSWGEPTGTQPSKSGTTDSWESGSSSFKQQSTSSSWGSWSNSNVQPASWTTSDQDTKTENNAGDSWGQTDSTTANSGWGTVEWAGGTGGGSWDELKGSETQPNGMAKDLTPPPAPPPSAPPALPLPPQPVSACNSSPERPPADVSMRGGQHHHPSTHPGHGVALSRPVSPCLTEAAVQTLSHKAVGPQARRKVWKETVKYHARAVRAELALRDAEELRDRYKRAQNSDIYARAGPLARAKLDNTRKEYEQRVVTQSKHLESYLKVLQNVPEIDRSFLDLSTIIKEDEITSYVEEVKGWIQDIRPLLIQITSPPPPPSPDCPSVEEGQIEEGGVPETRKRRRLSPERPPPISERFAAVEERVRIMAEEIHIQQINRAKIKDEVDKIMADKLEEIQQDKANAPKQLNPIEVLEAKDNESGQKIINQAEQVAYLLTRQREAEAKRNALMEQNKALLAKQASYQQALTTLQQGFHKDSARVEEMSQQIQKLFIQRQTTPFTLSEAALTQVGFMAQETFSAEVSPKLGENFQMINEQIANNDQEMIRTLWLKLDPALKLVERLTHWLDMQVELQGK